MYLACFCLGAIINYVPMNILVQVFDMHFFGKYILAVPLPVKSNKVLSAGFKHAPTVRLGT